MHNIFLYLVIALPYVLVLLAFFGISLDWAYESYDTWRLIEVLTILLTIVYSLLQYRNFNFGVSKKQFILLTSFITCCVLSIFYARNSTLALLNILWSLVLVCFFHALIILYRKIGIGLIGIYLAIMVLSPAWIIIWFLIGSYLYLSASVPLVWHGLFINIRYYGDALLPCIFLLWYQPSFLSQQSVLIVILSSLYLMTLYLDGSRAVCLSIILGLILAILIYRKDLKSLIKPFISILLSLVFYRLYLIFIIIDSPIQLMRNGSSNRLALWTGSLRYWLDHWFLGMGGGNFIYFDSRINYQQVAHPHNIFIQLLVEWGLVGIVIITLILLSYYYLFIHRSKIPMTLFAGSIAIIINALFSGSYIYPISQIIILLFFSFVVAHLNVLNYKQIRSKNHIQLNSLLVGFVAIASIIYIIANTFFQYDKILPENDSSWGPRFWSNAKAVNLNKKE